MIGAEDSQSFGSSENPSFQDGNVCDSVCTAKLSKGQRRMPGYCEDSFNRSRTPFLVLSRKNSEREENQGTKGLLY
jgi:hypothetical protein